MTKETARLYLPLIQALADGNQYRATNSPGWVDVVNVEFSAPPEAHQFSTSRMLIAPTLLFA